jgi:transposase
MSDKISSTYEMIRQWIQSAPEVGADETGCKVNGKKHWFHVWQNRWATFIVAFARRSHEVIEEYFPGGFLHSFYISDCYASQLKTPAKAHQLCLVHLLREVKNFEENLRSKWSAKMKQLLYQAMELKDNMTGDDYRNPTTQVTDINNRLDELLGVDYSKFHQKVRIPAMLTPIPVMLTPSFPEGHSAGHPFLIYQKSRCKVNIFFFSSNLFFYIYFM